MKNGIGMSWVGLGAISGFLAVALGAFGAHALAQKLDEKALSVFHTAAQYQMYHALALIAVGLWATAHPERPVALSGWAFALGSLVFCGSLYALALSGIKALGAITPIGGLLFMTGWISFAVAALRR